MTKSSSHLITIWLLFFVPKDFIENNFEQNTILITSSQLAINGDTWHSDTVWTCHTLTHNQHLKDIFILEIKVYVQREQKWDTMVVVVLLNPQLHNRNPSASYVI